MEQEVIVKMKEELEKLAKERKEIIEKMRKLKYAIKLMNND